MTCLNGGVPIALRIITLTDDLDENDYWPIEGFWDAYDLGLSHGRQEGIWNERAPTWFDEDELEDYHAGYIDGRAGK